MFLDAQDDCRKGETEKSAIAGRAWGMHHPIVWEDAEILDSARNQHVLRVKEALHIELTPKDTHFSRDVGVELPGCWSATIRKPHPNTHASIALRHYTRAHAVHLFNSLMILNHPDEDCSS